MPGGPIVRTRTGGWIVYKNPGTGRWYTRRDALAVLDEGNPGLAAAGMIG
jgi:hypothetical protein